MVNEACALPSADTAEACLKERLTHLSLSTTARRPATREPLAVSLKPFEHRGARPTF